MDVPARNPGHIAFFAKQMLALSSKRNSVPAGNRARQMHISFGKFLVCVHFLLGKFEQGVNAPLGNDYRRVNLRSIFCHLTIA